MDRAHLQRLDATVQGDGDAALCNQRETTGETHRVLVIEDDPALRETLCATLEGEGYRALASDYAVTPLDV